MSPENGDRRTDSKTAYCPEMDILKHSLSDKTWQKYTVGHYHIQQIIL